MEMHAPPLGVLVALENYCSGWRDIYREIARGKPRVRQAPSLYVESKQLHRLVAVD